MNKRKSDDLFRFSQTLQMVILTLILIGISCVLLKVFAESVNTSRKAEELNLAVQMCRNTAEIYESCGDIKETCEILCGNQSLTTSYTLWYNGSEIFTDKTPECSYISLSETYVGTVKSLNIAAYNKENENIYSLTVKKFLKSGGDSRE
ncbi:MAG: hypothetical protein Q4C42_04115 [Clostridia bacterium]|nr:hypothetical protein [Clostridia bacterium]